MWLVFLIISLFNPPEIKPPLPKGTVKISSNLYMDATEISTKDWAEFVYYCRRDSGYAFARLILPKVGFEENKGNAGREIPQTNITYKQAITYCNWRTNFYNSTLEKGNEHRVVFRLPTEEEWKQAVAYEQKQFLKRQVQIADLVESTSEYQNSKRLITVSKPKLARRRIAGLFHNASEMTASQGMALGMNNWTFSKEGKGLQSVPYTGASVRIGFRCVAEYLY